MEKTQKETMIFLDPETMRLLDEIAEKLGITPQEAAERSIRDLLKKWS